MTLSLRRPMACCFTGGGLPLLLPVPVPTRRRDTSIGAPCCYVTGAQVTCLGHLHVCVNCTVVVLTCLPLTIEALVARLGVVENSSSSSSSSSMLLDVQSEE